MQNHCEAGCDSFDSLGQQNAPCRDCSEHAVAPFQCMCWPQDTMFTSLLLTCQEAGSFTVTLEEASKPAAFPDTWGVPTFRLHPRATEMLRRTQDGCPWGHMPAEYLMCAAHREMEEKSKAHRGAGTSRKVCAQALQMVTLLISLGSHPCHPHAMPLLSFSLQSVAGSGRDPLRKREGHGRGTWQPQPW